MWAVADPAVGGTGDSHIDQNSAGRGYAKQSVSDTPGASFHLNH